MKRVIDFLEELAKEGTFLLNIVELAYDAGIAGKTANFHYLEFNRRRARWLRNCTDSLAYAALSEHLAQVERAISSGVNRSADVARITGVLESARDLLERGFVGNIRYLLHAEMFGSLVEQADELLKSGHVVPAAVVGRIVIENWLRDQAQKAGFQDCEKASASALNDQLRKLGVFSTPKWREIQSLLDLGNAAAHGKDADFSSGDVHRMVTFAKTACM